jgi:hypothetical protein
VANAGAVVGALCFVSERSEEHSETGTTDGTGQSQQRAGGDDRADAMTRAHAECVQQRELTPPPHHAQRLHRIHEEAAGEERHERERGQVGGERTRELTRILCFERGSSDFHVRRQ